MRALSLTACALAACLLAPAARAADNGCSFQPPQPALSPQAYPDVSFVRASGNRSTETASVGKGLRVAIARSQCADFIVTEITLVLSPAQQTRRSDDDWLALAHREIGRLTLAPAAGSLQQLQDFLLNARSLPERDGARSQCRDGSSAPAGQCSWDSTGGYVFRVTRGSAGVRVSVTEYISG